MKAAAALPAVPIGAIVPVEAQLAAITVVLASLLVLERQPAAIRAPGRRDPGMAVGNATASSGSERISYKVKAYSEQLAEGAASQVTPARQARCHDQRKKGAAGTALIFHSSAAGLDGGRAGVADVMRCGGCCWCGGAARWRGREEARKSRQAAG